MGLLNKFRKAEQRLNYDEEIVEHLSNVINGFSANTNNQNSNVISLDLKHREDKFKKVA